MSLKSLMVDTKSAWVKYPGFPGLEIEVVNLGREKLMKLRKDNMIHKFDRKTKQPVEELDEKGFISAFTHATVKNWKGFKLKYLEDIILVDLSSQDRESELPFSPEDAELLVANSADFDNWLNDVVFDLANFRSGSDKPAVGETGEVAG